jgi:hypothetical protein
MDASSGQNWNAVVLHDKACTLQKVPLTVFPDFAAN